MSTPATYPSVMPSQLRYPSLAVLWLVLAGAGVLPSDSVLAQGSTPVRQLGQSSPGFLPAYSLESEKLKRQRETHSQAPSLPTFIDDRPAGAQRGTGLAVPYAGAGPAWDAVDKVALDSMNPQRFFLGISVLAGWEYDDNPFLVDSDVVVAADGTVRTKEGVNSYYARLPVTLTYEGGRGSLLANYNPEFRAYDGQDIDDSFNHSAGLAATYSFGKLDLGLTASFAQVEGSNIEVGDRIDSLLLAVAFSASYALSPKTDLGASFGFTKNLYEDFNDNQGFTAGGSLDYEITPKTSLGVGVGYDRAGVEVGADSDALNVTARVGWNATEKFSLRAVAGGEWRKFEDSTVTVPVTTTTVGADGTPVTTTTFTTSNAEGETTVSPVFSVGALYNISEKASISLDGYRRSQPAISEVNQSYYSTGAVVTFSQRIWERFSVSLNGGFENADYYDSVEGVNTSRNDDYWFAGAQISYNILDRVALEIYYRYARNNSQGGGNGVPFTRNLVGASISYSF